MELADEGCVGVCDDDDEKDELDDPNRWLSCCSCWSCARCCCWSCDEYGGFAFCVCWRRGLPGDMDRVLADMDGGGGWWRLLNDVWVGVAM